MKRSLTLTVELLEDRCTPATWGNPWPDATHLTLSLAPDGTRYGDQASTLFARLDALMPRDVWQLALLRAFQTWAVQGNITIGLVGDDGQAFGIPGPSQGDPRFGDIRIGALAQASDALASSFPFGPLNGTWAGDVRINSGVTFGPGGYDLYTVLLQEAGHVFGLDNSPDPASVMYEYYSGARTGLSAGDVATLQALYGARLPDRFEGSYGNDTRALASRLSLLANADGSLGFIAAGDLTTMTDRDVYSFTTPLTAGNLVVALRTSGLSLLTARVSVYDSVGKLLKTTAAVDPRSGDLVLQVNGLGILSTYYVQVEGVGGDVFRVGGYQLGARYLPLVNNLLDAGTGLLGSLTDAATEVLANNDLHTNDSINSLGLPLQQALATTASPLDYAFRASISDRSDVDYYRIIAPTGTSTALTVMAWGTPSRLLPGGSLTPWVTVYDSLGNRVAAEVLVNDGYTHTVQVANATPGATYYVAVQAADPDGTRATGNYFLGADFIPQPVELPTLAEGSLNAGQGSQAASLSPDMSGVFHFVLSADGPAGGSVRMAVYDAAGNVVFTLGAAAGQSASGSTYLNRGTYRIVFTGLSSSGDAALLHYVLRGARLSDNNGPDTIDTTYYPSDPYTPDNYGSPPTVTSLSSKRGSTSGGTTVTISGSNFTGVMAVYFGGVAASNFTINSSTTITAVAPPQSAGTVAVTVKTSSGSSSPSSAAQFTYVAVPSIMGIAPASGPTSGGTTVTISGSNFTGVTSVSFGGVPASSFTIDSPTSITAVAPPHAAGMVDVIVTSPDGTSASSPYAQFSYKATPTVTGLTPTSGPTSGGTTVTLTGSNFTGVTIVYFGGVAASSFTINSSTSITAVTPPLTAGTVDVTVSGPEGTSAVSSSARFTYVAVPAIMGLSPASGPTSGGTMVTISGSNFTGVTAVYFGNMAASSFTINSSTMITAVAPPQAAGSVYVILTTPAGTWASSPSAQFTYFQPQMLAEADSSAVTGTFRTPPLTPELLAPLVRAAMAEWLASGLPAASALSLPNVQVVIASLPRPYLAGTVGHLILISPDAAGRGWFVDPTPGQHEEFVRFPHRDDLLWARPDGPAAGLVDLRTVVAHELGHVLGFDHAGDDTLMGESLALGVRRLVEGTQHREDQGPLGEGQGIMVLPLIFPGAVTTWSPSTVAPNGLISSRRTAEGGHWPQPLAGAVKPWSSAGVAPLPAALPLETNAVDHVFAHWPGDDFAPLSFSELWALSDPEHRVSDS